jgi:hypothetical protein
MGGPSCSKSGNQSNNRSRRLNWPEQAWRKRTQLPREEANARVLCQYQIFPPSTGRVNLRIHMQRTWPPGCLQGIWWRLNLARHMINLLLRLLMFLLHSHQGLGIHRHSTVGCTPTRRGTMRHLLLHLIQVETCPTHPPPMQ